MRAPDLTQWREVWVENLIDGLVADAMHIEPLADLIGHELTPACVCGPYLEHLGKTDYVVAHYALDKRP